ncbi:RING-H2 finger protein ATL3-like [Iris pallida]|uniref:RING-type E3 ubiquitin transferase n=1 Tax=Iris pallida TaxID=29817 RepID=A0AAX6DR47_IRIPA|nr:RING-H2 finger protein ATL3-like [Iris pallida]
MDPNTAGNPIPPATVSPARGYVVSRKIMLSGIAVLFAIVIFILFLHLYVRWHVRRRYDRRRRRSRLFSEAASSEDQNQRSAPRGLEKEVLNSLAVEVFSAGDGDAEEEADCAVCINEFDEGEKVRVLPRCGHRFHVDCIDMWFCSHSTCPLCRCAVEAVTSPPAPAVQPDLLPDPAVSELPVSDPDPGSREVRIEIPVESGSGSTSSGAVPVKLPGHRRMSSIRRFLIGIQTGNSDPERGEPSDRAVPPPPPATAE